MTRQLVMILWIGLQLGCIAPPEASAQSNTPPRGTGPGPAKTKNSVSPADTQRQELDEILKELRAIRALLEKQQAQPADSTKKIEMTVASDWHAMGNMNAPVTVVEFTDLQCPFCRAFERATFPALKTDYIDTGKIRFVSLDLPLAMHLYASQAAEAVQCAGDQGKFWELRSALFARQEGPAKSAVLEAAKSLGINLQQFQACLDTNKYKDKVAAEAKGASDLHIHGTPTFAVGRIVDGALTGVELDGALDYSRFQAEIDKLLPDQKKPLASSAVHSTGK